MFKVITKHWRKSKNFNSALIASLLVSFFFGKFISMVYGSTELFTDTNSQGILVLTFTLIFLLFVSYNIYVSFSDDLKDKQNFYDNFFISLVVVVLSTFMIIYNSLLSKIIFWPLSLVVVLIVYFPLNWLFIKLRPSK